MKRIGITTLCMLIAAISFAAKMEYTYNINNEDAKVYGFNKKETYDIAILLNDPTLVGAKVTGLKVLLPVDESSIDALSGWLSSELTLEEKKNAPDICTTEATYSDYYLTATFTEPYTITPEGVYVGYSFTITDLEVKGDYPGKPIAVVEDELAGGLFIHTSRSRLKWTDEGAALGLVSTMVVTLEGDYGDSDAAVSLPVTSYITQDEEYPVPVTIVNHGQAPIKEIGYSYTIGDYEGNGTYSLESPIESIGDNAVIRIPMYTEAPIGTYPFTLTLETVNGEANTDFSRTAAGEISVVPFVPVNRPLVEEYTGLNCGWCPRGYIAMEEMNDLYGDLFIGMAYHSSSYESKNAMVVMEEFPYPVTGYPYGTLNRMTGMDPSEFPFVWEDYRKDVPVAKIDVTAEWADDERSEIRATANVAFIRDFSDHDYKLAIALVADNLFNETWLQSNYYPGREPEGIDSNLWDIFINGYQKVAGLKFNDVVVYYKDLQGIEGALPETIKVGEEITYSYSVKMEDVVNLGGIQFINPEAELHFVAMVLDGESGYVVNANKSDNVAYTSTGVDAVYDDYDVIETVYYDLQGRCVSNPNRGIYLKAERLSNGDTRISKFLAR